MKYIHSLSIYLPVFLHSLRASTKSTKWLGDNAAPSELQLPQYPLNWSVGPRFSPLRTSSAAPGTCIHLFAGA